MGDLASVIHHHEFGGSTARSGCAFAGCRGWLASRCGDRRGKL